MVENMWSIVYGRECLVCSMWWGVYGMLHIVYSCFCKRNGTPGPFQGAWGLYKAGLELILLRTTWLLLELRSPFCGCPSNKSPSIWDLYYGP